MENEPLISVIVPVYNVEKYLYQCIQSIKNQTYKNLEIILIDDGSTDSSGELCDEAAKEDKRIKVLHKQNGGLSSARNFGIENANGKWLTFIDSDDYVTEDYVSYLYILAKKNSVKIAAASHTVFFESGKKTYKGFGEKTESVFSQKDALKHILLDDGLDLSAWAKIYSADLFKNGLRFPEGLSFEDTATTYGLFFLCENIASGGHSVYNYRIRSDSITTSSGFQKKMQLIENTDVMCNEITKKYPDLKEAAERRLVWAYFSTLNQLLKCSERKNFKKEEKQIVSFLKSKRKTIKKGSVYSKRDKLASIALIFGLPFYDFIWKIYSKIAKGVL